MFKHMQIGLHSETLELLAKVAQIEETTKPDDLLNILIDNYIENKEAELNINQLSKAKVSSPL